MANMLVDEGGSEEKREIKVSRLSTTSVVCGPTKDGRPANLSRQNERMSVTEQVEGEGDRHRKVDASFGLVSHE